MKTIIVFFCSLLLLTASSAQQKIPASTPLGRYLSADGLLRLPADVQGSLDPSGWKLRSGLRGAPAFTSSSLLSDPADTAWDARFDSVGGMDNQVYAITVSGTDVYVGGQFTTAGAATVNGIARWDGSSWHALGSGMNNMVRAIVVSGADVYASGQFTSAGGSPAFYVAKWDGSAWSPLGSGMDGIVYALAVKGSDLYAGGLFTTAGGVSASNIAKWDGSSWSALGSGMNSYVFALAQRGTDLIAGGDFTTAGGVSANRVASWDGSNWSALGSGTDSYVLALAMSGNDVVAGGDFLTAGGVSASRIARWDGSNWSALGAGMNNYVFSLATNGTEIYAGGYFTLAGGTNANYVARYDSLGWSALGSGTSGFSVFALGAKYGSLYAGGNFTAAGGKPSLFFGRWSLPPWTITASAGSGGAVSPAGSVAVENGTDTLFAFAPSAGYHVDSIVVDGAYAGDSLSYRFTNVTGNHAIGVTFAINVYAIAASAGANGTVTPAGSTTLNYGGSQSYAISPATGYHVADVLVDGVSVGAVTNYPFTSVTANHTISASFAIDVFSITASSGVNGSITPAGSTNVNYGAGQSYLVTPATGYHVTDVLVDGVSVGAVTSYPFTNVTANHTISASFAIDEFTITASSGANGTVTPAGVTNVNYGAGQSYLVTPATGYHVADVLVDGASVGAVTSYPFTNVAANHTISASFAIDVFSIAATSGANGTVTPAGSTNVNYDGSQSYLVTPATGYHVADVLVDGASVGAVTSYPFTNVTANHTISATFAIDEFTITASSGANGSVTPAGVTNVNYGAGQSYLVTPATGYHVADVLVDGASVGAVTSYPFTNVTANHTISATFAIDVFSITASSGANGTVTPAGSTNVNYGAGQSYLVTPATGYHVADVLVDGASVGAVTSYPFTNVTANHTISASFAIDEFTITASSGGNGTVTPAGVTNVNYGAGQSYAITPATGYHVTDVLVDGASVGAVTSYPFTNVTANHTISASFAIDEFTITASSGGNGTVTPAGVTNVNYGAGQSYAITPATGYHVADVLVDGASVGAVTSYPFTSVTANHTISATFAIDEFTITASSGGNGTVTPAGVTNVNYGGSQTYTISPATGYHVADVLVDGASVGAVTSYPFTSVTANHTISATFAINVYSIIATSGANGTVTPAGSTNVNYGAGQSYTISPATGYHVADVLVDGASVGAVTSYPFTNVTANHTISASFAIDVFSIAATSGANGTVTPAGSTNVNYGAGQSYLVTPATGYHVADVLVDGASVGAVTSYPFTNVTANHTISATFAIDIFSITASSGANGSVTPAGSTNVNYDGSQSYAITPATGYHVVDVLVDGVSVGAVTSYPFTNVTANHTISASFAIDEFTITASSGANGSVTPAGVTNVNYDGSQTYAITPATGYHVVDVLVDGVSVGAVTSYPFTNVTANHTISASFAIDEFTITASSGANGSVTPAGVTNVNYDGSQTYAITPATGYHVVDVLVDGVSVGAVTSYPFTNVTANHTISATFAIDVFSITATSGANGTVTPAGSTNINYGAGQSYLVTPATGYHVADVLVDGASVGAVTSYPFTNVTANHTISASFAIDEFTITASSGANGSVTPAGVTNVNYDGSQSYAITPATGYHVVDVLVDGVSVGAVTSYPFTNVTANHTISASFAIDEFTITASSGANGTVTPAGVTNVNYDGSQSYAITPATGYHVADVLVDGVSVGAVTSYPFTNVTANHTISASFAIDEFTITASSGANGSVTPAGVTNVNYDGSQSYAITPATGYHVVDVLVDGVSVGAVTSHPFTNVTANHTISASFAIDEFTITASSGANGSVTPAGVTNVNYDGSQTYAITPATGYHVVDVLVDGVSVGAVTSHPFTNVTANHTISATFAIDVFSITATSGANGTVTPAGSTNVNYDGSQSYAITPAIGYHVVDVLVDGVSVGAVTSYPFTNVTANHTISATFAIDAFTIGSSAGTNGTISPSGAVSVNYGGNQAYLIAANTGFFISDVHVDSVSIGAVASYTFTSVTANHTIQAFFDTLKYVITASAGAHGSVSPSGAVIVNYGAGRTFNFTPGTGFYVSDVHVDSVSIGAAASYSFTNVTSNHTVQAFFDTLKYVVTASAGPHGSIAPSGASNVNYGGGISYTITPNPGYFIDTVLVDSVPVGAAHTYAFVNVTANHLIHASFVANRAPSAASLLVPTNGDTLTLSGASDSIAFAWSRSVDPDLNDTVSYNVHVWGPGVDSTVAGLSDTTLERSFPGIQLGKTYQWTVASTDGDATVASADTFKFVIDFTNGVGEGKGLPQVYMLHQNYPNPFNPSTMIKFDLPSASQVTLKVYNLLGQEVRSLVEDQTLSAGYQEMRFDASSLPSGVYLYRMTAKGTTESPYISVKKMVLIK